MEIGAKIRRLRLQRDLTQEELADRCELSKGFISQLERDLTSPSIATLVDILEALGSSPQAFFSDTRGEKVVFEKDDMFEKADSEEKTGHITWLIPSAQKNRMEPILLLLAPGGATVTQDPHEGEEFGYVLAGSVYLHLGAEKLRVRTGESFCFAPNRAHGLSNAGKTQARVLWIATPPSF